MCLTCSAEFQNERRHRPVHQVLFVAKPGATPRRGTCPRGRLAMHIEIDKLPATGEEQWYSSVAVGLVKSTIKFPPSVIVKDKISEICWIQCRGSISCLQGTVRHAARHNCPPTSLRLNQAAAHRLFSAAHPQTNIILCAQGQHYSASSEPLNRYMTNVLFFVVAARCFCPFGAYNVMWPPCHNHSALLLLCVHVRVLSVLDVYAPVQGSAKKMTVNLEYYITAAIILFL
uniref:C2H2-type domain-containing protein n=1 Tax=Steinernema glaseri TaxID=37863 RepID=A0A1I7YIP2_9BILA